MRGKSRVSVCNQPHMICYFMHFKFHLRANLLYLVERTYGHVLSIYRILDVN